MKFNVSSIVKWISLVPIIIAGVEHLHGDADSGTKKQMAQDALTMATGVFDVADPAQADTANNVSSSVSTLIDSTVDVFNSTGVFQHAKAKASS